MRKAFMGKKAECLPTVNGLFFKLRRWKKVREQD